MEIKSNDDTKGIGQIYSGGMRYQLLNSKLQSLHPAIYCKDFISDVIWSEHVKKPASIYGFNYTPGGFSLKSRRVKIALDYIEGASFKKWTEENVKAISTPIHYVEKLLNIPLTAFKICKEGRFILTNTSSRWIAKPYLISLYTLLLRYGLSYKEGEDVSNFILKPTISGNDGLYLKNSSEAVKKILQGTEIEQTYEEYKSIGAIHNGSGIQSMAYKFK